MSRPSRRPLPRSEPVQLVFRSSTVVETLTLAISIEDVRGLDIPPPILGVEGRRIVRLGGCVTHRERVREVEAAYALVAKTQIEHVSTW